MNNARERTWPVGRKKPNDLGLFDMHGNVFTWCQERYQNYTPLQGEKPYEDKEDKLSINKQESRPLRGGAFNDPAVRVRSAERYWLLPALRPVGVGLRPARTFRKGKRGEKGSG
jgi:formylglycine-generating enzyme required for sulfatase activity